MRYGKSSQGSLFFDPWLFLIYSGVLQFLLHLIPRRKVGSSMFKVDKTKVKNANLFAAGLALGTVGLKVLTSKDAKKVYANVVAAGIRAKDSIMQTAEKVQASSDSILADAQEINEKRREEEALLEVEESEEK